MKLSLCIIGKNEAERLPALLESIKDSFDEVCYTDTGSTDASVEIAQSHGCVVSNFAWCDDFAAARNFSFSQATGDWLCWADCDDTLTDAAKLRGIAEQCDPIVGAVAFPYEYAHDEQGNTTTFQWRERLVRRGAFEWKGRLHEALYPKRKTIYAQSKDVIWVHHKVEASGAATHERNLRILLAELDEYKALGKKPEPLTLYGIANTLFGLSRFEEATQWYAAFIPESGWEEHRYIAWHRLAESFRHLQRYEESVNADLEAAKLRPAYPDAYYSIGVTAAEQKEWAKAEEWLKVSLTKPFPQTIVVCNPRDYDYNPMLLLGQCAVNLGKVDEAGGWLARAYQLIPSDDLEKKLRIIKEAVDLKAHVLAASEEAKTFADDPTKLAAFISGLPADVQAAPEISHLKHRVIIRTETTGRDLAIYCGRAAEEWDETATVRGCGGSEEAVIEVSQRLQRLGWNVTVYNNCLGAHTDVHGVRWEPWWEWNIRDHWDVFIGWRGPYLFAYDIPAKKRYLWLHDVTSPEELLPDRLANLDKVMFLTQFQRSLCPDVPDEKVWITRNGIDTKQFELLPNDRNGAVYTSSPDRGLEILLTLWPKVRERIKNAELHICYGWEIFKRLNTDNAKKMEWMRMMQEKVRETPGVIDHGRIPAAQAADLMLRAKVWTYPTEFPEISCLSAMKAQAAGCIPVCTDTAALKETVQYGVRIGSEHIYTDESAQRQFVDETVRALEGAYDHQIIPMRQWAMKELSWDALVRAWHDAFTV